MGCGDTARHGCCIHGNERHTVDEIGRSHHHVRIGFFWNEPSHPVRGFSLHVGTPCVLRVVVKILLPRAIAEALAPVLAERDAGDNTRRRTFPFLFCHYMTCHVRPEANEHKGKNTPTRVQ